MRRAILVILAMLVLAAMGVSLFVSRFNLSAMNEPGRTESYLAANLKHIIVRKSTRREIPPLPANTQASISEGDKLYGVECAMCHGLDGHTPTDAGRWMYPRAADLVSPEVQRYSDAQLFWIVRNGIRFSGMPAFGKVETDEHIRNLVHYVRSLRGSRDQSANAK